MSGNEGAVEAEFLELCGPYMAEMEGMDEHGDGSYGSYDDHHDNEHHVDYNDQVKDWVDKKMYVGLTSERAKRRSFARSERSEEKRRVS